MNNRNWLAPGLLLAAIGLPWVLLGGSRGFDPGTPVQLAMEAPPLAYSSDGVPLEYIPVGDFREIFHFDVSPQWISSRWNRVSVTTDGAGWTSYRVPLVTGSNPWDLHGSLTYSLDAKGAPKRIHFVGWTVEKSVIENMLIREFGFSTESTRWLSAYSAKSLGQLTGVALFRLPESTFSNAGNQQIAVWIEINDPRFRGAASDEARQLLRSASAKNGGR
ncbi:MAG TPA: hypothetical protein PKD54_08775 [Pirellulaceae bacterium]|nr:hypothetical protein [Pirellulaceae bacterium]